MASGSPSRRTHNSATTTALWAESMNDGSAARARSRNSATAATAARRSSGGRCIESGRASRLRGSVRSQRKWSGWRDVARTTGPRQVARRLPTSVAAWSRCSKLSSTSRSRRGPRWVRRTSSMPTPSAGGAPTARPIAAATSVGSDSREVDEPHVGKRGVVAQRLGHGKRQAGLAHAARTDHGQQTGVAGQHLHAHGRQLVGAADERRRLPGEPARPWIEERYRALVYWCAAVHASEGSLPSQATRALLRGGLGAG